MADTIDVESLRSSRLLLDVDKYRYKYQTSEVDSQSDTDLVIKFISPVIAVYEKYKFYLLKNSVTKDLSPTRFYRPDYVSYDEYGTTVLWTMLLFVNDIPSLEEFNVPTIYIPNIDAIYRIARETSQRTTTIEEVKRLSRKVRASVFTKKSEPTTQEQEEFVPAPKERELYFIRQTFEIDIPTAARQYVDLSFDAIPQSIVFKIKDRTAFIYAHDYILKENSSAKLRRISWKRSDVEGDGLVDVIEEGMVIEVQYAREL